MATPHRLLLTGFEPFGTRDTNPSQEVVSLLEKESFAGIELSTRILPVAYLPATEWIRTQITHFDEVIMLGVAWARQEICVERVAINLMDATRDDNSGFCPTDMSIYANAPTAYFSNAPIKQMAAAIRDSGYPCKISNSAGTFVCNAVYYAALHEIAIRQTCPDESGLPTQAVFIHLPSNDYLPIPSMAEAIKAAINVQICHTGDAGGTSRQVGYVSPADKL